MAVQISSKASADKYLLLNSKKFIVQRCRCAMHCTAKMQKLYHDFNGLSLPQFQFKFALLFSFCLRLLLTHSGVQSFHLMSIHMLNNFNGDKTSAFIWNQSQKFLKEVIINCYKHTSYIGLQLLWQKKSIRTLFADSNLRNERWFAWDAMQSVETCVFQRESERGYKSISNKF